MITQIARKEFTEMLRDGRFRWAASIVFVLLLASIVMGGRHYRDVKRQHDLAQAETREQWLRQPAKNPHSAAHYGVYAFKPKMLPSAVDRGVDPFVGQSIWLEAHKQNEFRFRPAQDATAVQRFGELTAATVMQLLIPLLIILLSFSAFAGEREQGTLRQLLSLGVKKTDLARGKALGVAGALGALIVPAAVIGVIALAMTSENGSLAASAPRMALMFASYLLYFASFIGLSLAVSARVKSSQMALVVLLAFWIVNGLIATRVVTDIAKRLYPTPSAFAFQQAIDREMQGGPDGHDTADKRAEALKQRVLKQYGADKLETLPVNFAGVSLQEGEEHGNAVFDKNYANLWSRFERQNQLKQIAGLLAPMMAIQSISMGLAGTDFAHHRAFATAAESYRRTLVKKMNDDMTYNAGKQDFSYLAKPALWQTVEDFRYEAPSTGWALRNQTISLAMLALWFVFAMTCAFMATWKMRVD
jgi:ABC-2 type transport system permease protein